MIRGPFARQSDSMTRAVLMASALLFALAHAHAADYGAPPLDASAQSPDVRLLQCDPHDAALPGATRPRRDVTLGASFDARVMELLVEEGDHVHEGQPVARLDDRVVAASLELAREEADHTARIDRARAQLQRNRQILSRTEKAHARGGANAEDVDEAKANVDLARAELDEALELRAAAMRRVEEARARLDQHTIRAPFDGVIVKLATDEGAVLRTGDPIAELADAQTVSVDLYLPAGTALSVETGASYALHLDAPIDRVVYAQARYVEPRIEPTSGAMRVVFDFDAPSGRLPAGLLVTPASRPPNDEELAFMRGQEPASAVASVETDE